MPDTRRRGTYETTSVAGETVRAFIPPPLPPDPALDISPALQDLIERANRGLGRLDGVTRILPDPSLFLYTYVRAATSNLANFARRRTGSVARALATRDSFRRLRIA